MVGESPARIDAVLNLIKSELTINRARSAARAQITTACESRSHERSFGSRLGAKAGGSLGKRLPKHFGEMADARLLAPRVQRAAQVREAAGIVGDHEVHARRLDARELAFEDAVGDLWEFEAERSAEAAAHRRLGHLDDLHTGDLPQERPRRLANPEHVRRLAGVVVGRAKSELASPDLAPAGAEGHGASSGRSEARSPSQRRRPFLLLGQVRARV